MATCKDCLHFEACKSSLAAFWENKEMTEDDNCRLFKNKEDFVEVVRCEKCKFGEKYDEETIKCCIDLTVDEETGLESGFASYNDKKFYCGYAGKKEGAEE